MASMTSVATNPELKKACIIIAGNRGSGKSTALNNIFHLDLETADGPVAVTTEVEKNTYIKESVEFTVLDTPGGAELQEKSGDIEYHLKKVQEYTVLLCLRVDAGNRVNDGSNIETIKVLQSILGKEVWKKCVILFTFSDFAWEDADSIACYKEHINKCSRTLNKIINDLVTDVPGEEKSVSRKKTSITETDKSGEEIIVPQVKSVFEIDNILEREETEGEIIAFPVGANRDCSYDILPGILDSKQDWTDLFFLEFMRKTGESTREAFILVKYGYELALLSKMSTAGSRVGAFIGATSGAIGGPLGFSLGAKMGAQIGIQAGRGAALATNYTIGAIRELITYLKSLELPD